MNEMYDLKLSILNVYICMYIYIFFNLNKLNINNLNIVHLYSHS